jgi:diguanylate cyclase (GGDEF)-like protein
MNIIDKVFYPWQYYSFGQERYDEYMGNLFVSNLLRLRQVNMIIAIVVGACSLYPLIKMQFFMAGVYLVVAVVALLLAAYANYKMQVVQASNRFIYVLITLFYANIMLFGTYLSVWSSPDRLAAFFFCVLICALLMFIISPFFNLCLTLGAVTVFIVSTVMIKAPSIVFLDIVHVVIAGTISLYFNWYISKLRLGLEISADILEDERNNYLDESTIDELTKLKNRRDFMGTFERYLSNYRTSDIWLCVAICDVDYFKNYNDHYGHPMGDDCLRAVGKVLNDLMESVDVYAARVGGEEFALLWFENDPAHIDMVINHIIGKIGDLDIPHAKSKVCSHVTLSIGVYVERCGSPSEAQTLYDQADKSLYAAKEGGRNCAVITGADIAEYKIKGSE